MDFGDLLKILFGQVGALGTLCIAVAGWAGWMHWQEKEDHKQTRLMMYQHFEKVVGMQLTIATVLAELKTILMDDEERDREVKKPGRRG